MNLDLLASIEITACAAIAIAVLAAGFGEDTRARVRIASALGAWYTAIAALAALGAFRYQYGFGVPAIGTAVMLPIAVFGWRVLRSPSLRHRLQTISLSTLIGVNAIRVFGATFLVLHAAGRLSDPFASVAGWGDILVGIAAVPVAWLTMRRAVRAHAAVWIWNTFGLLDLVAAVALGIASSPGPLRLMFEEPGTGLMTALPWMLIPGFLVPLLASTHLAVFYRLAAGRSQAAFARCA